MKQVKKMKEEQTYGWYPSVRDVYLSKNQPTPYHLECLYKFQQSGYHNPLVDPPEPAFVIRGITPTPPPSRPSSSARGPRSKSVPVPKFRPVPKMTIPTPQWRRAPAETSWGVVTPTPTPTQDGLPASSQKPEAAEEQTAEKKPEIQWPTQQIVSKYDKPFAPSDAAEEVFGTPLPPREPGSGGDSGYVFIPTGDGGVEVHSPPTIHWPDSYPRTPTPQHSASSKASLGSADGIASRRKAQEEFSQQVLKEKEEKRKLMERQRRFDNLLRQQHYHHQQRKQPQPPGSAPGTARGNQTARRERIQSATTRRDKTVVPQRPVYSARPSGRPASDTALYTQRSYHQERTTARHPDHLATIRDEEQLYRAWEEEEEQWPGSMVHQRPMNPLPPTPSLEDLVIEEDRSPSPDYQQMVDKFGWRAEVHGDPYNIKKTTKRLPYTVKCEEPVVAPEPPSVHMESKETFFLNTIPRRLATFDVHQDWLSEGLCAQRMELQKRNGVNYRYKNFAFAY